jgi:nicotinamidase-related amidase
METPVQNPDSKGMGRREFVISAAGAAIAAAGASQNAGAAEGGPTLPPYTIPELAPQWKALDLARILKYPAAFLSVSQNNSLYKPWGAQAAEKQWERPSLPATVKVAQAARRANNFRTFAWIGYEVFRESYPQSEFDRAQYASWIKGYETWPLAKKKADNDLVDDLKALVRDGDLQFNELALQTAFVGTELPLHLSRQGIKTVVITGIHTDWCIEGNARAARDHGLLPIVIGDATATQRLGDESIAFQRINSYFAPVISSDTFVKLLSA